MRRKIDNHETCLKQCEYMHEKFIEIEKKHCTLEHHVCYNHISRFKNDEGKVAVIPPENCSYDWIAQFLHQIQELVTIDLRNECYNKRVHLKSKTKS